VAGPPARLVPINVPASISVESVPSIVVKVTDSVGIPVAGAAVTWSVVSGKGSFLPVATIADSNGIVGTSFRPVGPPGQVRVRATMGTGAVRDFDITVLPGPLSQLTPLYTDLTLRVGSAFSVTVQALDLLGYGIPGIVLTSLPGDVQYTNLTTQPTEPLTQTTDATGSATFRGTVGALPGLQRFRIEGPVSTQFPNTFTAWVRVRATGDQGYITPASGQPATLTLTTGATAEIDVVVIQADGSLASQASVTFTLAAGNGSILDASGNATSSSSTVTDNTGLAKVKWRLPVTRGTYTISATAQAPNDGRSPLVITAAVQ
jgi:hypothetical protein